MILPILQATFGWDYVHETLNGATLPDTTTPLILPDTFLTAITNRLTTWLADTGNGIGNIFAGTITVHNANVDNLCVKKSNGTDVCITGDQLDDLLSGRTVSSSNISTIPEPTTTPTPTPAPDVTPPAPASTPTQSVTPEVGNNPTPVTASSGTPPTAVAPDVTPVPEVTPAS